MLLAAEILTGIPSLLPAMKTYLSVLCPLTSRTQCEILVVTLWHYVPGVLKQTDCFFLMLRSPPAGEISQRASSNPPRLLISEQKRQGETIKAHERS